MTQDDYPEDRLTRRVCKLIERWVTKRGSRFIFTTQSAREMYLRRYPKLLPDHCLVIPNGYDDCDFVGIPGNVNSSLTSPVRLVHSGLIYPRERDPRSFLRALERLKNEGGISRHRLRIDFRASGSEDYYSTLLRQYGVDDLVRLLPALPHREALRDAAAADGLLLFQAASCNHQIPAKVYEYLRLRKPIFALTSMVGDTATLLKEVGGATIVDLEDENSIVGALPGFLTSVRRGIHPLPDPWKVYRYTRRNETSDLARCLDQLTRSGMANPKHNLSGNRRAGLGAAPITVEKRED